MIIIHMDTQQDTHVLDAIYKGMSQTDNKIMVNPTREKVEDILRQYPNETAMFIGHGDFNGLWASNDDLYNDSGYVIDPLNVDLLYEREVICIWCYAVIFGKKYKLRGFFTNMFVSNPSEATALGFGQYTEEYCNEQNVKFCEQINKFILENVDMSDWTDKLTHDDVNFVNYNYKNLKYLYGY